MFLKPNANALNKQLTKLQMVKYLTSKRPQNREWSRYLLYIKDIPPTIVLKMARHFHTCKRDRKTIWSGQQLFRRQHTEALFLLWAGKWGQIWFCHVFLSRRNRAALCDLLKISLPLIVGIRVLCCNGFIYYMLIVMQNNKQTWIENEESDTPNKNLFELVGQSLISAPWP